MVIELSVLDLSLAALLILALAGLSLRLGLGIEQRLVISAARTTRLPDAMWACSVPAGMDVGVSGSRGRRKAMRGPVGPGVEGRVGARRAHPACWRRARRR